MPPIEPSSQAVVSQAEIVTQRLAELGMSVSQFARELGVAPSYIHACLASKRRLTRPETVERAAEVLGISADRLFVSARHLPPDVWMIVNRRPMLVQALRVLDAKLDRGA